MSYNSSLRPPDPLPPTDLKITNTFEGDLNITVQFEWDPSLSAPEFAVDGYQLSLTADADFFLDSTNFSASSASLNVTLDYNVEYMASVISINCVGESTEVSLHNILFGKNITTIWGTESRNHLPHYSS